jgi:hypothetical protein
MGGDEAAQDDAVTSPSTGRKDPVPRRSRNVKMPAAMATALSFAKWRCVSRLRLPFILTSLLPGGKDIKRHPAHRRRLVLGRS